MPKSSIRPHQPTDDGKCAHRGCDKLIKGKGSIIDKDGRIYCKQHGERIPPYLRRAKVHKR